MEVSKCQTITKLAIGAHTLTIRIKWAKTRQVKTHLAQIMARAQITNLKLQNLRTTVVHHNGWTVREEANSSSHFIGCVAYWSELTLSVREFKAHVADWIYNWEAIVFGLEGRPNWIVIFLNFLFLKFVYQRNFFWVVVLFNSGILI